jgi:hypothetical protein
MLNGLWKVNAVASQAWVTTNTRWCDKMNAEASMMERRVYPAEIMPDFPAYQVTARKCTLGISCNIAGYPCKWAYSNIGDDPFEPSV